MPRAGLTVTASGVTDMERNTLDNTTKPQVTLWMRLRAAFGFGPVFAVRAVMLALASRSEMIAASERQGRE
jgi:hypothetical protein